MVQNANNFALTDTNNFNLRIENIKFQPSDNLKLLWCGYALCNFKDYPKYAMNFRSTTDPLIS